MGSPRLKKKVDLHYRRGPASGGCSQCNHYVLVGSYYGNATGKHVVPQPACLVMGLKPGRAYRINPNNICDRFDNSKNMARLKGEL